MKEKTPNKEAGKGDSPRNCFSDRFKQNYDIINWSEQNHKLLIKKELKKQNGSVSYIYR